jgi:hypothetical protein
MKNKKIMRAIKSFDLFQKLVVESQYKSTLTGSLFSILVILLLTFLVMKEIILFFTPLIIKDSIVQNKYNTNQASHFKFDIKVKFYDAPCPIISLDLENLLGAHIMNLRENVKFFRYSYNNELIKENDFSAYQITPLEQALKKQESCFIDAHLNLHKSAGDVHFSFHKFREVYEEIKNKNNNKGIFKKLNVSHKIFKISLTDENTIKKIKDNFGVYSNSPDLLDFLDKYEKNSFVFPNFFKQQKNAENIVNSNYEYFMVFVPQIFHNEYTQETIFTYLFSMTYKEQEIKQEDEEMPLMLINYDFSPITMKFTLVRKSFLHFLTNICAIIGGVFVFFKLMHNVLTYF